MAISYIGQATGVTSATLPTHQAGDLILAFAYRDGSTTPPTVPSPFTAVTAGTGSGGGGAANSSVVGSFVATGSGTSSGTWTNATSVVFHVYRSTQGVGAIAGTNGSSTTITYPALGLNVTNGSSWVAGFAGHQSTDVAITTAPSGMTNRSSVSDATDEAAGHDTNGGVSSWSQQTASVGGTSASWRSWTVEILDADTDPPTVTTFSPANAATGVLTGANIALTFNEAIQRGTGTITIRSGSASGTILESIDAATSGRISISGSVLTIDPTSLLPVSTQIFVVIPSGAIKDVSGYPSPNNYAGTSTYSFTTEAAPTLSSTNPANGATNVATNSNIALTLDKNAARGTGTITLRSGSAAGTILESFDAASSGRISISGATVTVDPTALLPTSTQVFLVVPSGAIKDTSGNDYAGTSTYSFTTEAAPVANTFSPLSGATNVQTDSNLVVTFSKTIARGTGTITLRSGSAAGTILESFDAASSNRLTLSGSTFTVDPTALLPTNTQVFLVIPSGAITDTSGNAYTGTSTYSFTTQTAPTVSTFSPTSGATGVLTGTNAVLTFDRSMARGTGTITIRSGSAAGTILESLNAASSDRISISGSAVTIDPTALLPTSTQVFVVIPSGALLDTVGNPYAGTSTYSFTTEAAPTVSTFSPASGATGVGLDDNIVLTFSKTVARGTGTLTLRLADNTVVETFNAASSPRISLSGSTYTVDPTARLDQQTVYYLDIPAGAITDTSGNPYAGTTSYSFTTVLIGVLFPESPAQGDTYTFAGRKWRYDGTGWERPLVSKLGDTVEGPLLASSTDHWRVPVGTTAQRPGTPLAGMIRFNSTRGCFEGYTGSAWVNMSPLNIDDVGATA